MQLPYSPSAPWAVTRWAPVSQEQALLRWDGQTEDILMSLGVLGSSSEAVVILPVAQSGDGDAGSGRRLG